MIVIITPEATDLAQTNTSQLRGRRNQTESDKHSNLNAFELVS